MPINYQKNIFNENRDKNRFKSKEFVKMDNEEVINKIEQDILTKKKKKNLNLIIIIIIQ